MKASKTAEAFSLTELLVVISIIILLAALGLPGIKGAMDRAKSAKCGANLRQIWSAYNGYLSDHNGEAPQEAYTTFPMWIYDVMPYAIGDSFYTDYYKPNKPLPLLTCPSSKVKLTDYYKSHYAINVNLLSYLSTSSGGYRTIRPMVAISHPSAVMLAMDTYGGRRQVGPNNMPARNSDDWKEVFRHSGNANVLYLDGHVGQLKELSTNSTAPWVDQ